MGCVCVCEGGEGYAEKQFILYNENDNERFHSFLTFGAGTMSEKHLISFCTKYNQGAVFAK